MRGLSRLPFPLLLALAGAVLAVPAVADDEHDRARQLMRDGEVAPLERIIATAREQYAGKILEAKLEHERGRWLYELEMLGEDGKVWELYFDARSGELIDRHPEH